MSNANKYPTTLHRDEGSVQLHDGGSGRVGALIDNALANLTTDQAHTLAAKAADAALKLEVKAREQNLDYVAGKKALEDHLDAFRMLDRQGHLTRHTIETVTKTGAGTMRVESKAGAHQFPLLVPISNDEVGVTEMMAVHDALAEWHKPTLVAFADQDPVFPYPKSGDRFTELIPTAGEQVRIENAGHFLQEDKPEEIVAAMRSELFS